MTFRIATEAIHALNSGDHTKYRNLIPAGSLTRRSVLAMMLGWSVSLAGCSEGGDANAASVPDGGGNSAAPPIPAGQIDAAVAKLDELAADLMRRSNIPGMAVAVVKDGKTIYAQGFGVRKVGESKQVDTDTVFQLASMSKAIGATVVAGVVGRKEASWDTPVVSQLPNFRLADASTTQHATIGDFYAHRSGLEGGVGDELETLNYGRQSILQRLRDAPLLPFRMSYNYTNFGMTVGAEAAAAASGLDWATLSERTLYQPLEMGATSSRFADFIRRSNRATPHVKRDGRYQALYQRQPDPQSPAGGVSSSVNDLAKWMSMVLQNGTYQGRSVIKAEALQPAISPQIVMGPPAEGAEYADAYGFGFVVSTSLSGRVKIGHSGAFLAGAGTSVSMIPSLGIAIVTLTNAAPTGVPEALNAYFEDLVEFGEVRRDWFAFWSAERAKLYVVGGSLAGKKPPNPAPPPLASNAYTGTYTNSFYGNAEVVVNGNALVLKMGPDGYRVFPLQHWSGNSFAFKVPEEGAPFGTRSRVDFKPGVSGVSESMQIEAYAGDIAQGVFMKAP